MSWDEVPWQQTPRQQHADDLLADWAGEVAPSSASAYPQEWQIPDHPTPPPAPRVRRRRRRQEPPVVPVPTGPRPSLSHPGMPHPGVARLGAFHAEVSGAGQPGAPSGHMPPPGDVAPTGHGPATGHGTAPYPGHPWSTTATPARRRARAKRAAAWSGLGIAVVLALVAGVVSSGDDRAGSSTANTGTTGSGTSTSSDPAIGSRLSPYGLPIDMDDLGVVPADHTFTFDANPDLTDYHHDGWRPASEMVRVYLDPELTVAAPDAEVRHSYEGKDEITVSAGYDTTLRVSSMSSRDDDEVDVSIGERWGASPVYYIAQLCDLQTGEPLDRIPVQRFEVEDTRPRPVVDAHVDDQGVLQLAWEPVDGAVRYDVLEPTYGFSSFGATDGTSWSSDVEDEEGGYRQNAVLAYLSSGSEESEAILGPSSTTPREIRGIAVTAVLSDGRPSVVPVDSALLAQVPLQTASHAWSQEDLSGQQSAPQLPGAVPFEMVDGSTMLLPTSYDPDGLTAHYGGSWKVPLIVHGARPSEPGYVTVVADSQAEAAEAVRARNAALDTQRDPHGPPEPYQY
ncbi:hypothetical protein [Cellulomonas sp. NPDC089187]|uniref:hypothetical protein n=1 Tax=Cellulomonas sp. NPDC089187 TaxID=3154970 RepID=UPI00341F8ABF